MATDENSNMIEDLQNVPTFEQCKDECKEICELGVRTSFNEAIDELDKMSSVSIYHSFAQSVLGSLRHLLTLEKADIDKSLEHCQRLLDLCDKYRKSRTMASSLWRFFAGIDPNDYTDFETHVFVTRALAMQMQGLAILVSDTRFIILVKAALRMQSAYSTLKDCEVILDKRTNWDNEESKNYFKACVNITMAFMSLVMSHFPQRVMKFLTFLGYDCDREKALAMIQSVSQLNCTYMTLFAYMAISIYECIIVSIFGSQQPNTALVISYADKELAVCPTSSWGLLTKAIALKLSGDIDAAIDHYNRCLDSQKDLRQLRNLCHWDLSFCYGLNMQWDLAAECAEKLVDSCNWSKSTFAYMRASFLYMKMIDENRPELETQISLLMGQVSELKQRFAGKTIPPEKYVCVNAEKYFRNNKSLPLPAFDLFYIWNIYAYTKNNVKLLDPIIQRIENCLEKLDDQDNVEDYSMLQLIKGVCLKYEGKYNEAESCFDEIFAREAHLDSNRNLLAMASLEMGLTKLELKAYSEAESWLKKAEKYRKYFFKMIIHFRAHSALQRLKECKRTVQDVQGDSISCPD